MKKYPLEKNQDIELEITGITAEGSGVGHYDGVAVFVSGTAVGDKIECHIIKTKKNYAVGKIKNIITASSDRIMPDCCVFDQCGGCVYRHIDYEAELNLKQQQVVDAFTRIGHMEIHPAEIMSVKRTDRYRNKAQYPVRFDEHGLHMGFFARKSHRVVDCRDCLLQPEEFKFILDLFARWIIENNISVYDEETNKGLIRHIYIRKAFATDSIMVCVVINGHSLPKSDSLTAMLLESCPDIKSIVINENTAKGNVILGKKYDVIWGDEYIEDILCGIKVRISPLSFYQVNHDCAELLYSKAAEYADVETDDVVLDLYCGAGTIGLSMADKVKQLIGVEIVPEAVKDAKTNAAINNIQNAEFICGDAALAAEVLKDRRINPNIVIVDPPRKGCAKELLNIIVEMSPEKFVYISCDVATLARDCALMTANGYVVIEVTPVDMFPRTGSIENVVLMKRQNNGEYDN